MTDSRVLPMFDAVHGPIELSDPRLFQSEDVLPILLESPQLQRLRRLQQLPFGSYAFTSANHTRFAHAIGTAHSALKIMQQLHRNGFFDDEATRLLRGSLPALSDEHGRDQDFVRALSEHMVIAGLVQDIGELPFKAATDLFFYADPAVVARVSEDLEIRAHDLGHKDIFTLHGIIDLFDRKPLLRDRFDIGLLAHMITGVRIGTIEQSPPLAALRHILDGVVDADRLDYVHRDAHHTIGVGHLTSVSQVVGSLITYDEQGPVFDSKGPVSNFLMLRAILRSQVYSAPENRFRFTLLAVVLSEFLRRHPEWMERVFDAPLGSLTADGFNRMDDESFLHALKELRGRRESERLSYGARRAMDLMDAPGMDYQYYWEERPSTQTGTSVARLRTDFYVDTYWDYENHALYDPGSVRVRAEAYALKGGTIPLERVGGHVSQFLEELWDSPIQSNILLFVPRNRKEWITQQRSDGKAREALYRAAVARDAEIRLSVVDDTRNEPGFTGPAIFISFCWEDIDTMRAVLRLLYDRKRRYFAFVKDFHGLAGGPNENGATYAGQSDAAILLFSRSYLQRTRLPNGAITAELIALGRRLHSRHIVPLTLDPLKEFTEGVENGPWTLLGFREPPYLGAPIRGATPEVIAGAVDAALKVIDRNAVTHEDR
ncbi:hypothetical protein OG729_31425 [Streptomyces sp. NBC_00210]|uniref:hypothetical protein n=1 Tax=unclassified Streptomyces TaxID=2593676 RepID=UPI003252DE12